MSGGEPAAASPTLLRTVRAYALLLLALVVEGYDLQAANFAAPDLVASLGISRSEVGPLLSASLVGVLIGAVMVGPLGDRFGRKRVIIVACIGYGILSLLAARAETLGMLIFLRFLIGIGLGGVLPNALALAGELAPKGQKATATALIGIGITFGGVVAGGVAAELLPIYGWPALFFVGGILPLAIALLLQLGLPESPEYLAQRSARDSRPAGVEAAPPSASYGPRPLFRGGMLPVTLAIWVVFASVLMNVYLLSGWIPLLMADSGFSARDSALLATVYHGGGLFGGVVASLVLKRGGWSTVAVFALSAAASLALLAAGPGSNVLLAAAIIAAGFFVTGTQNAINGATGVTYPTEMRAAGLGWALGIGRVGSILGPLVGSAAVLLGMTETSHFFALPLLPLIAAGVIALWLRRRTATFSKDSH